MIKAKQKIVFLFLIIFSIYCAFTIGKAWDEGFLIKQGEIALNYLFSLGRIEEDLFQREYYSPIYYSFKFLLIQIFPIKYQIEASHLINLIFSLSAIVGIKKLSKELFNESVGKIVFLVLFFYPIFFGHMGFNSKDTIIAFCHVWIFYLCLQYIKKQHESNKANIYINFIAVLSAVGTGINLYFLGTLLPVIIFLIIDIFLLKKITKKTFNKKKFFIDLLKGFVIFYFLLVIFWIDTHPNIFILPFTIFIDWVIGDFWRSLPYTLVNGDYFIYREIPKSYLLINLIYKSPEYLLFTYIIFLIIFFKSGSCFFSAKITSGIPFLFFLPVSI